MGRFLRAALAAFFVAFSAQAGWVEGTVIGIPANNPKEVTAIFVADYPQQYGAQPGVWTKVNVYDLIGHQTPTPIVGVMLGGLGVVTKGSSSDYCNLRISVRRAGTSYNPNNYIAQVLEAHPGGGQRSPTFIVVAVDENGNFEYHWLRQSGGTYPTYCANLWNVSLQGYIRE